MQRSRRHSTCDIIGKKLSIQSPLTVITKPCAHSLTEHHVAYELRAYRSTSHASPCPVAQSTMRQKQVRRRPLRIRKQEAELKSQMPCQAVDH